MSLERLNESFRIRAAQTLGMALIYGLSALIIFCPSVCAAVLIIRWGLF